MALRKQIIKDGGDFLSESQQSDENTQVDGDLNDRDDNDELSSSLLPLSSLRENRRRERENKSKPKVLQQQSRMALRKQIIKDGGDVLSESQQSDENTQVDGDLNDRDDNDELSSSLLPLSSVREKRKRENKSKPKEMTEEEMMDLALRLSEQEASITALRLQKEEEAVMKAIQESMVSQTQPCPSFQSQNMPSDAESQLRLCSRRKLLYSNRKQASGDGCSPEPDLNGGAEGPGDESPKRSKKRKRREGSPLLEMPDLSQTQKTSCLGSPRSSESLVLQLDSTQSCDLTQIEDLKSPVFPSTGCRTEVPRLSQNLLDSCRTSGFVLCSQDSSIVPLKSQPDQLKSPTFPQSPKNSRDFTLSRSPVFSEAEQGEDSETQLDPVDFKSPVFGQTTQHEKSPSACRPPDCTSAFGLSSQESLSSSVMSTSCQPQSPVFSRRRCLPETDCPPDRSGVCRSPVFSRTEQTEQRHVGCKSPVFDRIEQRPQTKTIDVQNSSDKKTDHVPDIKSKKSPKSDDAEEELTEIPKDQNTAEMEMSCDMKLLWSDDDEDDVTPTGSPSPVFPKERIVLLADSETAPMNHVTAASSGINGSNCSRQHSSTSEPDSQPTNEGTVSRSSAPPGDPACEATVHYYWGVPFCPRGLNPDSYTQVILAQMEVYEKSLKQAQRCLLRKAEWGEAVLPQVEKSPLPESQSPKSPQQDVPKRRGLGLRRKPLRKEAMGEEEEEEEEEEERAEGEETQEKEPKEEVKKNEGGGEGQVDSDDCEICPETQLSNADDDDKTQDLRMETDAGEEPQSKSPEEVDVEVLLRDDSPAGDEPQEEGEMEVDVDAQEDRTTKVNIPVSSSDAGGQDVRTEEDRRESDVEEMNSSRLQRSTSPELEPAAAAQSSETSVDCPICQGSFPVTEIEMHAAYCDGEIAVVHQRRLKANSLQVSLKPRRKRTRRSESREEKEETDEPFNTGKNQEKCYVCHKAIPLREYNTHTELCIQLQTSKTSRKGNLLSALEHTDSRDSEAGPSGSKHQTGEVIELLDDDDDDDCEENTEVRKALTISNSPIRAFTPISEATDCLIDFKKQRRVKKPSQRRR
ncbi:uncharacterized protein uimc1 isoform X3 [Notolabrus celidotus]|uniref:uncharacterized protein uimc1 isoform X3 n=1 Tax=Notolabrus celidotus TaxID=1203425 RepID=UPI00148F6738|nr:uncharacterized protein uimc1 isoform X3 [Notolabrus celidotus]